MPTHAQLTPTVTYHFNEHAPLSFGTINTENLGSGNRRLNELNTYSHLDKHALFSCGAINLETLRSDNRKLNKLDTYFFLFLLLYLFPLFLVGFPAVLWRVVVVLLGTGIVALLLLLLVVAVEAPVAPIASIASVAPIAPHAVVRDGWKGGTERVVGKWLKLSCK